MLRSPHYDYAHGLMHTGVAVVVVGLSHRQGIGGRVASRRLVRVSLAIGKTFVSFR